MSDFSATQPPKSEAQIYDVNGMKLQQLKKGINILRHADGTTQKVVVK